MKKAFLSILCLCSLFVSAQDFEKKSKALNLELLQGFTDPESLPPLYLGDLRLSYQYTLAKGFSIGAAGGALFNNDQLSAYAGPNLALLLKQMKTPHGTIGNIHLLVEHFWGTNDQKLIGGGLRASIGNSLLLSLLTHRDYCLDYWNFQFGIGINFLHKKRPLEPRIN